MKKRISLVSAAAAAVFCSVLTFMFTYTFVSRDYRAQLRDLQLESAGSEGLSGVFEKLSYIDNLYRNAYYGEIDDGEISDYVMRGYIAGTGDKYGMYYSREEYTDLIKSQNAEMEGIGINIIYNAEYGLIEVINVMPDSPALEAGVMPGDLIAYIGDEREGVRGLGYEVAIDKLRGKAGTHAVFTVLRGAGYNDEVSFTIERGYMTEQSVMHRQYEPDPTIGIIRILQFDLKTPEQFNTAVDELRAAGVTKLIFDVRYNPGGDLNSIVSILDYLLPEGPIIRTVDVNGNEDARYSEESELEMPMVVLTNGSTASAAELFSAALRDYDKAILVGQTTYGKGSMQTILPLPDSSAVKLTMKMYFPPFSGSYEDIGIVPDVEVDLSEEAKMTNIYKLADADDAQLQAAIDVINS